MIGPLLNLKCHLKFVYSLELTPALKKASSSLLIIAGYFWNKAFRLGSSSKCEMKNYALDDRRVPPPNTLISNSTPFNVICHSS